MPSGKHGHHARGSSNGRWNPTGKIISSHGYVKVRVGRDHPLADPNGYAYEHTLVLAAAGVVLRPNQVAHHRNGDKTDNGLPATCRECGESAVDGPGWRCILNNQTLDVRECTYASLDPVEAAHA